MKEFDISLFQNDRLYRLQRRIGLIPAHGMGLFRRAFFFAFLAWLPLVIWALVEGRFMPGSIDEPLLRHFGIHVRYLIAVPLLILGEGISHRESSQLIPQFLASGLLRADQRSKVQEIALEFSRLSNSTHPWVMIVVLLSVWFGLGPSPIAEHEMAWATEASSDSLHLGFGGLWLAYVARPIFITLVMSWLWRLVLLALLMKRISGLNLALIPTHPDRVGGLGFLETLPTAFSPFILAVSSVVASRIAHDVVYHGAHVLAFKGMILVLIFLLVTLCLLPLLVFVPTLMASKRKALKEYGVLVGEHGRQFHMRWIHKESSFKCPMLDAPEMGSLSDTLSLYDKVSDMRPSPVGKTAAIAVTLPAVIPFIALLGTEIPLKDLILKIAQILI